MPVATRHLEHAVDVLKGSKAAEGTMGNVTSQLIVAKRLIEMYQSDIRERGLDQEGFCQGSLYREYAKLLVMDGT